MHMNMLILTGTPVLRLSTYIDLLLQHVAESFRLFIILGDGKGYYILYVMQDRERVNILIWR